MKKILMLTISVIMALCCACGNEPEYGLKRATDIGNDETVIANVPDWKRTEVSFKNDGFVLTNNGVDTITVKYYDGIIYDLEEFVKEVNSEADVNIIESSDKKIIFEVVHNGEYEYARQEQLSKKTMVLVSTSKKNETYHKTINNIEFEVTKTDD